MLNENHKMKTVPGELTIVADYACETGENPLWHPDEQRLYWTDIPTGRLFRFDPQADTHQQCYAGRPVGGFTLQADGSLLLFMDRGTVASWRNGEVTILVPELAGELDSRFNDVIADPRGRVLCGTMSTTDHKGRLYCMDVDGTLRLLLENIGCSNGMAFTEDQSHFFYTDSFANQIYRFKYSVADGSLSDRTVFSTFSDGTGLPDGCTLDSQGSLWSALWDGSGIVRLDDHGQPLEKIVLPVPKVTSLTFGGENLQDMYITTAGGQEKNLDGPFAGALFRFRSANKGRLEHRSRILLRSTSVTNIDTTQ